MKMMVFSVQDAALGVFANPFCCQTEAVAVRMFRDWCSDTGTVVGKHPGDFTLYQLGVFDVDTGLFENLMPGPKVMCHGLGKKKEG